MSALLLRHWAASGTLSSAVGIRPRPLQQRLDARTHEACRRHCASGPHAVVLLDSVLSPTRQRGLHVLEIKTLASACGASLRPLAGEDGWIWAVEAPTEATARSAAAALAARASALRGAIVDAVSGRDPQGLVQAARGRHVQQGRWALRREAGGTKKSRRGSNGRETTAAIGAALGAALGGAPAPDGAARHELSLVVLDSDDESLFLLGVWVPADDRTAAFASWRARPFHFSSGLDFRVAEAASALALVQSAAHAQCTSGARTLFVDPCCGSGTTVLSAASSRLDSPGALAALDVSSRHLLGALQNFRHAGLVDGPETTSWGVEGTSQGAIGQEALRWCRAAAGGPLLALAVRDAAAGLPVELPMAEGPPWRLVGVANLAWGVKQATTAEQTLAVLAGLRRTFAAFPAAGRRRLCCILGPEADARELLEGAGWTVATQPTEVFRTNCRTRVLCTVTVAELP
mmetsp:Transcript_14645/g.43770  ORF Transcript_14645/g.43770 Transcript_14645/m.43770 type:complete len:461 (+) Transcript_14645:94-1476(+)